MATITTADFRPGVVIRIPEGVYSIISAQHTHTARGSATVRVKIRNVETGQVLERTFQAKEKVDEASIDTRKMEFLYRDGDLFHFMDPASYEQEALGMDVMESAVPFLKENMEIRFKVLDERVIGVELPDTVELVVADTEPGVRGDTVSGATKPAKMETGHVAQVPLFIETGETLKIDTRTGAYLGRAGR